MDTNEIKFNVTINADGACSCNPGIGGYCALLRCDEIKNKEGQPYEKQISGYCDDTTNNKMELRAAIAGISALKFPCNVTLRVDSKYVLDTFRQLETIRGNDWKRGANKRRIPNYEMWEEMYQVRQFHNFTLVKVDGHSGDPDNERCDKVAKREILNRKNVLLQEVKSTGNSLHKYVAKVGV